MIQIVLTSLEKAAWERGPKALPAGQGAGEFFYLRCLGEGFVDEEARVLAERMGEGWERAHRKVKDALRFEIIVEEET